MREKNEFYYVVHAIGVCKSVSDGCLSGEEVEDVECGHPVGRILGKKVYEFVDEPCSFYGLSGSFIEAEVVVDHE